MEQNLPDRMMETAGEDYDLQKRKGTTYVLCLVFGIDQMVAVYLPGSTDVEVGDILFFEYKGELLQRNIKYLCHCSMDHDIWTAVTVATQLSPIKAVKYARMTNITWDVQD